jgi:hypothetical protein
VLSKDAAIGFAMIQMLAEWNCAMGDNAPAHEHPPAYRLP